MSIDIKFILAAVVAVGVFMSAPPGSGQTISGIPAVNFICYAPEPLFHIVDTTYNRSVEEGTALAESYMESQQCWPVPPTPVEVLSILKEQLDPDGKLWAIVAVKPHEITNFEQRVTRFAVMDAELAKAYLTRHQTEETTGAFSVTLACLELDDVLALIRSDHEDYDGGWERLQKMLRDQQCVVFDQQKQVTITKIYATFTDTEGDDVAAIGVVVLGKSSKEFFSVVKTSFARKALAHGVKTSI
jgi:hypothetical protein